MFREEKGRAVVESSFTGVSPYASSSSLVQKDGKGTFPTKTVCGLGVTQLVAGRDLCPRTSEQCVYSVPLQRLRRGGTVSVRRSTARDV